MGSSNPRSINHRKIDAADAAERAEARKANLDQATGTKPGGDGHEIGNEVFENLTSGDPQ